jgi:LmbE family N-acetylglucosaminyl deacetylase
VNKLFDGAAAGRVLAFGAHPDDIEVGAGGLLARLADEGADVTMAVVSVPSLRDRRLEEAAEGARRIGAKLVMMADRQCRVEDIPMHELVARFDQLVGDVRPELVITHAEHDLHWDHGLVNRATISALRRTPCDLLAYHSSMEMNAQTRSFGQCFADVTDSIDIKVHAIAAHASQMTRFDPDSTRDLARALGRIAGLKYAECYEVLRLRV